MYFVRFHLFCCDSYGRAEDSVYPGDSRIIRESWHGGAAPTQSSLRFAQWPEPGVFRRGEI